MRAIHALWGFYSNFAKNSTACRRKKAHIEIWGQKGSRAALRKMRRMRPLNNGEIFAASNVIRGVPVDGVGDGVGACKYEAARRGLGYPYANMQ